MQAAEEAEILAGRQLVVESQLLGDQAELALGGVGVAGEGGAVDQDVAVVRAEQAGDQRDRRGLAGAVGAEDADDLAGADLERHAVHGAQRAEGLPQAADLEHGSLRLYEVGPRLVPPVIPLFGTQRDHGIDAAGTRGGKVRSQGGDAQQEQRGRRVAQGVERGDAKEK